VDRALALRRDLDAAADVLATVNAAEGARSRHLALLADLTRLLPDSSVLVALRVAPDSTVRLAGYAASGARVLAQLEQVPHLRGARLEGPLIREALAAGTAQARTWDRFAVVARLEPAP
jgi:Tfp pilus assembly protein PilN